MDGNKIPDSAIFSLGFLRLLLPAGLSDDVTVGGVETFGQLDGAPTRKPASHPARTLAVAGGWIGRLGPLVAVKPIPTKRENKYRLS